MTEEELRAIEARTDAATPGPWRWSRYDGFRITLQSGEHHAWSNAVIRAIDTDAETEEDTHNAAVDVPADEDAWFIIHAREDVPALCAEVRRLQSHTETVVCETDAANERASAAWQRADQAERRESEERAEVRRQRALVEQQRRDCERLQDLLRETDERKAELGHQNERLREETAAACLRADRAERGEGWLREHAAAMTNERDQWREEALQHDTTVAGAGAILRDWADPV